MSRENKRRDLLAVERSEKSGEKQSLDTDEEEVEQQRLGDRSVLYRYVI
jgi:hypothetical protein